MQRYDQYELPRVKWLDKLSFRRIEKINQDTPDEDQLYLIVDLPNFRRPIVFHQMPCNFHLPYIVPLEHITFPADKPSSGRLFVVHDPEMDSVNPIETKYLKLDLSMKRASIRDLKPSIGEKKLIQSIVNSPNRHLTGSEKALLLKFRYSLVDNKRALNKFARCIDWADSSDATSAMELIQQWTPIDIADSLELLSMSFSFAGIRRYIFGFHLYLICSYAVDQLDRADDEEFQCYLLQLVQALKYEKSYPSHLSKYACFSIFYSNIVT